MIIPIKRNSLIDGTWIFFCRIYAFCVTEMCKCNKCWLFVWLIDAKKKPIFFVHKWTSLFRVSLLTRMTATTMTLLCNRSQCPTHLITNISSGYTHLYLNLYTSSHKPDVLFLFVVDVVMLDSYALLSIFTYCE